jgi:hypothetical protein
MKTKSIIAALLLAASSAFAQVPSYVPTNGLLGWWPFNGNANDESGNGNNGTVNGATLTSDRNGQINSAYNFNVFNWGWGSGGDYVYMPYKQIYNSQNLTVSTWFKKSSTYITNQVNPSLIKRFELGYNNPNGQTWGLYVNTNGDSLVTFLLPPNTSNNYAFTLSQIGPSVTSAQWHNATMTFDGFNMKTYYDGQLISTKPANGMILNTNGNSGISVGMSIQANGHWDPFNGVIDDIGIWNRALTQQEITALYNSQTCNSSSNTITADGPTTFCAGNSVNLKSDVVGGTYQWKKNGVNISTNATSRTYKASSTGSYTCVATCNGTALTSNAIAVTSKTNAAATVSASGATSFCAGDSVTLNATNLGSNYSVQWYRTNVSMENATNYSQVVKQPGTYKVVTRNLTNGCSRISGSAITTNVNCRIANNNQSEPTSNDINEESRTLAPELSQGVNLFPNPNNGSFKFTYEGEVEGEGTIQVISAMGQVIYQSQAIAEDGRISKEIFLGDQYQKGIYIVRLLINGGQNDSRMIVQ